MKSLENHKVTIRSFLNNIGFTSFGTLKKRELVSALKISNLTNDDEILEAVTNSLLQKYHQLKTKPSLSYEDIIPNSASSEIKELIQKILTCLMSIPEVTLPIINQPSIYHNPLYTPTQSFTYPYYGYNHPMMVPPVVYSINNYSTLYSNYPSYYPPPHYSHFYSSFNFPYTNPDPLYGGNSKAFQTNEVIPNQIAKGNVYTDEALQAMQGNKYKIKSSGFQIDIPKTNSTIENCDKNDKERKQQNLEILSNRKAQQSDQINSQLKKCPCNGQLKSRQVFTCKNCKRQYHYQCLNIKHKKAEVGQAIQEIICSVCKMRGIDPLNEVAEVIYQGFINKIKTNVFEVVVNLRQFDAYLSNTDTLYQIECRCIRIIKNQVCEIGWPDDSCFKINNLKVIDFPALQHNSALKKRKDTVLPIGRNIFQSVRQSERQKIKISLEVKKITSQEEVIKKINNDCVFALGIYLVKKLTTDTLFNEIMNSESLQKPTNFLQQIFQSSNKEVQIEQITVSLLDPYTKDLIVTPVRGTQCQHAQCFDLKVFITLMSSNKIRLWRCPVCYKESRNFMLDIQQLQIISKFKANHDSPQITFSKDGEIIPEKTKATKLHKTKKICKNKITSNQISKISQSD